MSCALIAGGGINSGQVIGSPNRLGEYAKDRPVSFSDCFATIFKAMGLNPKVSTINDQTGRPKISPKARRSGN